MHELFGQTVTDWQQDREVVRRRRYGVIETSAGRLVAIHFRLWPKLIAWPEVLPLGPTYHARGRSDRCLLYFNQPLSCPNFLALKYVVSTAGTPYATFRAALTTLDAVAELKRSDAILCDAFNQRLSDRFLRRLGWEPHKPQRWHRNYIKRFYGSYPSTSLAGFSRLDESASVPVSG
ncbi:MAG: hypothetical protein AAGD11_00525 [Planctomycetota bacterium]